jgi:hypothetical protein
MLKDLILSRRVILVNAVIFTVFLAYFATAAEDLPPGLYAGMASFMLAFLPVGMVIREDKFDAMILQCSLPVSRRKVVQARFILSEGMAIVGVLAAFLLGSVVPHSQFSLSELLAPAPILTGLTLVTMVLSLLLPFSLRFGAKGLFIFLIGAQVVGVILFAVVVATQSSIDNRIVEAVIRFFVNVRGALGGPGFSTALLGVLVALLGLSYLVSLQVFENRDL